MRVGVVLLSSCQGVHALDFDRKQMPCLHGKLLSVKRQHMANGRARSVRKDRESAGGRSMDDYKDNIIFPVADTQSASPWKEQTI